MKVYCIYCGVELLQDHLYEGIWWCHNPTKHHILYFIVNRKFGKIKIQEIDINRTYQYQSYMDEWYHKNGKL